MRARTVKPRIPASKIWLRVLGVLLAFVAALVAEDLLFSALGS